LVPFQLVQLVLEDVVQALVAVDAGRQRSLAGSLQPMVTA
jgi:hypothetical protein